jgi:hypothetical protein
MGEGQRMGDAQKCQNDWICSGVRPLTNSIEVTARSRAASRQTLTIDGSQEEPWRPRMIALWREISTA